MNLVDLMNLVPKTYDQLHCSAYECDICIGLDNDKFEVVNHVELRFTEDLKHSFFVFYHDKE